MAIKPRKPQPPSAVVKPPRQVQPSAAITPPVAPHGGASWFDMFAPAPALEAPQPLQMPQPAPAAAAPPVDPLTAYFAGGQQQQPMIPPFDIVGAINALRSEGPTAEYNKLASLPSNAPGSLSPFATGFFSQPSGMGLSPEAVLASQGNTATNQWAQAGGVPSINPQTLQQLNRRRLY